MKILACAFILIPANLVVAPGDYALLIGDSSDAIKLTRPLTIIR